MSNLNKIVEELTSQIEELSRLKNDAKLPKVQTFIQNEINRLTLAKQNHEKELNKQQTPLAENIPLSKQELGQITVTNYMWDQTQEFVKIYIEINKNEKVDSSDISLKFNSPTNFTCVFGKYRFTLNNLFKDIDGSKSKAVITKSNRLIITLYKRDATNWSSLQIVKSKNLMDEKPDYDPNEDPSAALMKMMKKMYDEGDDEMKRTIAKSWYDSQKKENQSDSFKF